MPYAAPKPCRYCGTLVRDGTSRCQTHRTVGRWGDAARGSSHERGYGWQWQQLRKRILTRDKGLCQVCLAEGKFRPARDVDHIVHKADGGTDDDTNLQAICAKHHAEKTAREAVAARLGGGG
jgi:5-methylcytosine-specific restriction protein A